jgi:polyhydroxyalkanoate synthesis regulator phasin
MLVMQDLKIPLHSAAEHGPVRQRLEALERRVSDLEEKGV